MSSRLEEETAGNYNMFRYIYMCEEPESQSSSTGEFGPNGYSVEISSPEGSAETSLAGVAYIA